MTQISSNDRMTLNAAMGKLISEEENSWLDAAQLVTDFGRSIPSGKYSKHTFCKKQSGSSSSGYASGIGNVSVPNEHETGVHEQVNGQIIERVGSYQICHCAEMCMVQFWNYRESLPWKRVDHPARYVILYDRSSGIPHTFGHAIYAKGSSLSLQHLVQWIEALVRNFPHVLSCWIRRQTVQIRIINWYLRGVDIIHSTNPKWGDIKIVFFRIPN